MDNYERLIYKGCYFHINIFSKTGNPGKKSHGLGERLEWVGLNQVLPLPTLCKSYTLECKKEKRKSDDKSLLEQVLDDTSDFQHSGYDSVRLPACLRVRGRDLNEACLWWEHKYKQPFLVGKSKENLNFRMILGNPEEEFKERDSLRCKKKSSKRASGWQGKMVLRQTLGLKES